MHGYRYFLNFPLIFLINFFTAPIYSKDAPLNFSRIANKISNTPYYEFLNKESFDLLELSDSDWSSMQIGTTYIQAPSKAGEILDRLKQIESELNGTKDSAISFKYGNRSSIILKLPFLGRGKNGAVYEIQSPLVNEEKVIKIALPRLQSIQSGIIEYESYDFWSEAASNAGTFFIPKQYEVHKLGLYRIMEKNKGITLTKYLLMLGAIRIDDLNKKSTSFNPNFLNGIYRVEANKIAKALESMIHIVTTNPKYCVSLSPNNIHVTFDASNLTIERIDLVDIGPVPSKLGVYQNLTNFNQFLELCAERLQKYISLPEYQYDIDELTQYQDLYVGPIPNWRAPTNTKKYY